MSFQRLICKQVKSVSVTGATWFHLPRLRFSLFSRSSAGSQGILQQSRPNGSAPIFGLPLCDTQDVIRKEMTAHSILSLTLQGVTHPCPSQPKAGKVPLNQSRTMLHPSTHPLVSPCLRSCVHISNWEQAPGSSPWWAEILGK